MKNRQLYLISYDISDAKRLRAALKLVRGYATGGQLSVHECWLSTAEKGDLLATLSQIIDEDTDSLMAIKLDPRQKIHTLGKATKPTTADLFYMG